MAAWPHYMTLSFAIRCNVCPSKGTPVHTSETASGFHCGDAAAAAAAAYSDPFRSLHRHRFTTSRHLWATTLHASPK